MCADLDRRFPHLKGRVFPLGCGFWHDGVAITFKLSAHPCVLFALNIDEDFFSCDINTIRLGTTCPSLNKRFWPKGAGCVASRFKALTSFAEQQCLEIILEEFWDLNRTGIPVQNLLLESGRVVPDALIVPYLPLVSLDLDQAWKDQCVRANGLISHLTLLATKDDLDDPLVRCAKLILAGGQAGGPAGGSAGGRPDDQAHRHRHRRGLVRTWLEPGWNLTWLEPG